MRLGLPRTRTHLTTGVLMASCVAASAVLVGQHATPAEAATKSTAVVDRIPTQHAARLAEQLAKATPAPAGSGAAQDASKLAEQLAKATPAPAGSATVHDASKLAAQLATATPAATPVATKPAPAKPAAPAAAKPAPAKPAPAKPAPAKPAAKTYPNNLDGWIAEARDILAAHGDKVPSAASIQARAMTESSGNPHAENHWDSNQALYGGTFGLIQTIKPTFAQYSLPGHKDIFNPVDNIIAGVRYANDRYGSFETVAFGKQGY